jgi:hypothetical protein
MPKRAKVPDFTGILNGHTSLVVARVGDILAGGDPTRFALMAACRHGLRCAFIECGHRYDVADAAADRLVLAALNRIGARWPRWAEGQPEYTQFGFSPIERRRCIHCHGDLPEGHRKFCSELCGDAFQHRIARLQMDAEAKAAASAKAIARAAARRNKAGAHA